MAALIMVALAVVLLMYAVPRLRADRELRRAVRQRPTMSASVRRPSSVRTRRPPTPKDPRGWAVYQYRHRTQWGRVYIGSGNAEDRDRRHRKAPWYPYACPQEVVAFHPTRQAAYDHETGLIRAASAAGEPLANDKHNVRRRVGRGRIPR